MWSIALSRCVPKSWPPALRTGQRTMASWRRYKRGVEKKAEQPESNRNLGREIEVLWHYFWFAYLWFTVFFSFLGG